MHSERIRVLPSPRVNGGECLRSKWLLIAALGVACAPAHRGVKAVPPNGHNPDRTVAALLFDLDGSESAMRNGIEAIQRADIAADVLVALGDSDHRLVALYGYTEEVPGLPNNAQFPPAGYVAVAVKGTSDYRTTATQITFHELVRAYARKYNAALLARQGEVGR
jgi:hypothetical protein